MGGGPADSFLNGPDSQLRYRAEGRGAGRPLGRGFPILSRPAGPSPPSPLPPSGPPPPPAAPPSRAGQLSGTPRPAAAPPGGGDGPRAAEDAAGLDWDSDSNILNLSTIFTLTPDQRCLLERGLTYCPPPTSFHLEELRGDLHRYHRRVKLIDYFDGQASHITPFTLTSGWEPGSSQLDVRIKALILQDNRTMNQYIQNLHFRPPSGGSDHSEIIKQLQHNQNIIIKPADKGSKIVIMDSQQYILEANRQLNNPKYYKKIDNNFHSFTLQKIRPIIQSLYYKKYLTAKQRDFLYGSDTPRNRLFYLLPKIHKPPSTWTVPHAVPPGRPIVSDCSSATYNISQYIDHFLGPLSSRHPSYLKDTYHFLSIIRPMLVPTHSLIFTIDIDSLYTNINTTLGLQTIQTIFNRYPDPKRPDKEILTLLELCLKYNDFEFNGNQYLQVEGTAMGHRYAPSYANLYMSEWEREVLELCPLKPLLYLRFLDDIIGVWPHGEETFPQFIHLLNNHHPSIKVKYEISSTHVNFLDTTVFF